MIRIITKGEVSIMPEANLNDLLKTSAREKGDTPYIGTKVKNEVFEAICGVFGVPATTSGTALFKEILSVGLRAKNYQPPSE